MSKMSFTIAFLVSVALHGMFLLPEIRSKSNLPRTTSAKTSSKGKVVFQQREGKTETAKEEHVQQPQPEYTAIEKLKEIAASSKTVLSNKIGDFASQETDKTLPELRLTWDGPQELIEVARDLNMRILAVKKGFTPVGELQLTDRPYIGSFDGGTSNYSNRIRTIHSGFFGSRLIEESNKQIDCFWVLVPATVDREWICIQKDTIRSNGLNSSQIAYMEARIVWNKQGYQLVITRIVRV